MIPIRVGKNCILEATNGNQELTVAVLEPSCPLFFGKIPVPLVPTRRVGMQPLRASGINKADPHTP